MDILIVGDTKQGKSSPIWLTKEHVNRIKKVVPGATVTIADTDSKTNKLIGEAEIIIHSFGKNLNFGRAKKLRWLHSGSAGVTDLAAALKDSNILLTNSSGIHPIPIAETVAGYMLMFARRLNNAYRNQILEKAWVRNIADLGGFELSGKTVGIVGYGRIGGQIAKICQGLGMKVAALEHDKKGKGGMIDHTFKNIDDLLKASDFVVDCLPLTPATQGYFDIRKFKIMLPSSYFINIGRGRTVVEKDLIQALRKNVIAGAGLDVFEIEPLPASSPLWKLPNVIITPHVSGWTPEYTNRVIDIFCTNLKAYLTNKPMPNLVDKARGY